MTRSNFFLRSLKSFFVGQSQCKRGFPRTLKRLVSHVSLCIFHIVFWWRRKINNALLCPIREVHEPPICPLPELSREKKDDYSQQLSSSSPPAQSSSFRREAPVKNDEKALTLQPPSFNWLSTAIESLPRVEHNRLPYQHCQVWGLRSWHNRINVALVRSSGYHTYFPECQLSRKTDRTLVSPQEP